MTDKLSTLTLAPTVWKHSKEDSKKQECNADSVLYIMHKLHKFARNREHSAYFTIGEEGISN